MTVVTPDTQTAATKLVEVHSRETGALGDVRAGPGRGLALAALAAAGCLWGTGFLFGKIALGEMSVGHMVLYRFLFACLGLLPVALRCRAVPRREDLALFLLAAAMYVPVQFLVEFQGLARTTVSHASLMVGTLPLLLAVGAVIFTHERLDRTGWLLLGASSVGAALIVIRAHADSGAGAAGAASGPTLIGDVLVFISMFAGAAWVLITQRLMHRGRGYPAVITTLYSVGFGTVMLAVWVLATEGLPPVAISARAWGALAAQGLLATALTTLLWTWGLTRVPAARAGVFINLEPVVGAILGVMLLHESLGPTAIVGGVLIVGAAVAFTYRQN